MVGSLHLIWQPTNPGSPMFGQTWVFHGVCMPLKQRWGYGSRATGAMTTREGTLSCNQAPSNFVFSWPSTPSARFLFGSCQAVEGAQGPRPHGPGRAGLAGRDLGRRGRHHLNGSGHERVRRRKTGEGPMSTSMSERGSPGHLIL